MDDVFHKLYGVPSEENLVETTEAVRQTLAQIEGVPRLDFVLNLLNWIEQYPLLREFEEEVINDVLKLAKETSTEQAASLLSQKAYNDFINNDYTGATHNTDLALKKSRDVGSNKAEVESLIVKGYLCDTKKEHKKASAWYTMALAKCTKFQRPRLMLNIVTSLIMQGEYSQAWSFINQAQSLASDLSEDMSLKDIERRFFKGLVASAYLQLGQVHEGIEDIDGALRAYDKGLSLSLQHGFTDNISQIYYHQEKAYLRLGRDSEAEALKKKVRKVLKERQDINPVFFFDRILDLVHEFKNLKQYEMALNIYRFFLFEDNRDAQTCLKRLNDLMDNQTNTFLEIIKGITVCLNATDRVIESETISKEEAIFSELKQQAGILGEKDRDYKLRIQKNSLGAALMQIFFPKEDFVEYKNIQAQYDPKKDKAIFKVGEKEIKRARRYFLVFKCLFDNAGEPVTGEMLDKFVIDQGEPINKKDSGLRVYVGRLKKDINLAQFLVPHEGKGWMLQAP